MNISLSSCIHRIIANFEEDEQARSSHPCRLAPKDWLPFPSSADGYRELPSRPLMQHNALQIHCSPEYLHTSQKFRVKKTQFEVWRYSRPRPFESGFVFRIVSLSACPSRRYHRSYQFISSDRVAEIITDCKQKSPHPGANSISVHP
jgi:hypothetical protein